MNKIIYILRTKNFFIATSFLLLMACASNDTSNIEPANDDLSYNPSVKFKILSQGQHSNISFPNQFVFRNLQQWKQSWSIHGGGNTSTLPTVNFENDIVIAIFAGQQPSGGYLVGVSNIMRKNENLFLTITFKEPKPNENVSLAHTQPFIFISTAKVKGNVIFLAGKK